MACCSFVDRVFPPLVRLCAVLIVDLGSAACIAFVGRPWPFGWGVYTLVGIAVVRGLTAAAAAALLGPKRVKRFQLRVGQAAAFCLFLNWLFCAVVCLVRLIGDPPQGYSRRDDVLFWTAVSGCLLGSTCLERTLTKVAAAAARQVDPEPDSGSVALNTMDPESGSESLASTLSTFASNTPAQSLPEPAEEEAGLSISRIVAELYCDWYLVLFAFVFLVAAAVCQSLIPMFLSSAVTEIIHDGDFQHEIRNLIVAAAAYGICSSFRGATFIVIAGRFGVRLRAKLFRAVIDQDIAFFDSANTGELTSRLTQDCQKVVDQVELNVNIFFRSTVGAIMALIFMFGMSFKLSLLAFVSVPATVVISKVYGQIQQAISKDSQERLAQANAVASESLSAMPTVRAFAAEGAELERFTAKLLLYRKRRYDCAKYYLGYCSTVLFLPQAVTAVALLYGGKLVKNGELSDKVLLSFVLYLQTLNDCFSSMGDFWSSMSQAVGAADKTFKLIDVVPSMPLEDPHPTPLTARTPGAIQIESCRFAYPTRPTKQVLRGLSLDVPAGSVVALVGPSGQGKSTVIALLQRFYQEADGIVSLDGEPVRSFRHSDYHRVVTIVSQEPTLFARTIKANILYGIPEDKWPDDAQVFEAARTAFAHDFISEFPEGYDTEVGERGVKLSGGQRQRIAITRALVRKPKVLLLDEATSALDAESEKVVQEAIDGMMAAGNMTVVVIAHRLSTVRKATKICVLAKGQVVEEGTHDELLSRRGAYFRLVKTQLHSLSGPESVPEASSVDTISSAGNGDSPVAPLGAADGGEWKEAVDSTQQLDTD